MIETEQLVIPGQQMMNGRHAGLRDPKCNKWYEKIKKKIRIDRQFSGERSEG